MIYNDTKINSGAFTNAVKYSKDRELVPREIARWRYLVKIMSFGFWDNECEKKKENENRE